MADPSQVSVVIPAFNEEEGIGPTIEDLLSRHSWGEVLVVDDGSTDATAARASAAGARVVRHPYNKGNGAAVKTGIREAGGRILLLMDGDGQHDPAEAEKLVQAMGDHDMVIGSRYVPGGGIANWKLHRRVLSRFANWYTRVLLGLTQHDCTSGYRGYRREVLESVDPFAVPFSGYSFLEEMVWRVHRAGFRIAEVPIVFTDRHLGISKIDRYEIFMAAWHVLATAWDRLRGRAPSAERPADSSDGRRPST